VFAWLLLPCGEIISCGSRFSNCRRPFRSPRPMFATCRSSGRRSHSKDELIAAARDLRHVYAGYEFQAQQTDAQQAEITRLERLLRLPSDPHFHFEPARGVPARTFPAGGNNHHSQRLELRSAGGAPVVYGGGVVGRVRESGLEADVDLVSSPRCASPPPSKTTRAPVSYQAGTIRRWLGPRLVEFVPPDIVIYSSAPDGSSVRLGEFPAV